MGSNTSRITVVGIAVCFLITGCATVIPKENGAHSSLGPTEAGNGVAGKKDVEEVRKLIESGQYSIVIPRLLQVISKYPESDAAIEAHYWLGLTYYEIKSYREAISLFNDYLRLAPQGEFAESSAKLVTRLQEEYETKYWTAAKLDKEIDRLTKKIGANPKDASSRLELANLLWKRGDYEQSGRMYVRILEDVPGTENNQMIASRIEFLPNGQYLVLTPSEVQRRTNEKQPLSIINVNAFKSGEDLFTRLPRYYVVTGQGINRSESVLYGTQVIVTIYGFGNVVYDTRTVTLGRLNPGEIRAFSVRFSNFPDIHNIHRYECVGTFER